MITNKCPSLLRRLVTVTRIDPTRKILQPETVADAQSEVCEFNRCEAKTYKEPLGFADRRALPVTTIDVRGALLSLPGADA